MISAATRSRSSRQHEAVVHRAASSDAPSATLLELQKKLNERGVEVGKSSIGRFLKRLRISYKKNALRGRGGSVRT